MILKKICMMQIINMRSLAASNILYNQVRLLANKKGGSGGRGGGFRGGDEFEEDNYYDEEEEEDYSNLIKRKKYEEFEDDDKESKYSKRKNTESEEGRKKGQKPFSELKYLRKRNKSAQNKLLNEDDDDINALYMPDNYQEKRILFSKPYGTELLNNPNLNNTSIRVVMDGKGNLGEFSLQEALKLAEKEGLDLVCIAEKSKPPICKILSYSAMKVKMERDERKKILKEKKHNKSEKEIKFSAKIQDHDFNRFCGKAFDFLSDGYPLKATVTLKNDAEDKPYAVDLFVRMAAHVQEVGVNNKIQKRSWNIVSSNFVPLKLGAIVSPISSQLIQETVMTTPAKREVVDVDLDEYSSSSEDDD